MPEKVLICVELGDIIGLGFREEHEEGAVGPY